MAQLQGLLSDAGAPVGEMDRALQRFCPHLAFTVAWVVTCRALLSRPVVRGGVEIIV